MTRSALDAAHRPRRRWVWRALVSALAGSGITAASLGPVAGGAFATKRRHGHRRRHRHHDDLHGNDRSARTGNDDDHVDAHFDHARAQHHGDDRTGAHDKRRAARPADRDHAGRNGSAGATQARREGPGRRAPAQAEDDSLQEHRREQHDPHQAGERRRPRRRRRPTTSPSRRSLSPRRPERWRRSWPARRPPLRRSPSTAYRCSCCRSTRPRRSSTACPGRSSRRSTKSRPTTAPTSRSRPPAPSAGCSSCRRPGIQYGVDALERRLRGPVQPGRRDLRRRPLPARRRRRDEPARGDPRLQPLRRICRLGAAAREADLQLPEGRDRDAHRPRRRAPARRPASRSRGARCRCARRRPARPRAPPRRRQDRSRRAAAARGHAGAPGAAATPRRPRPRRSKSLKHAPALQLVDLTAAPNAYVVAVQDGRVVQLGSSPKLGKFMVLRDVYGDVFTYAGLGSIAPQLHAKPKAPHAAPVAGRPSRQQRRARRRSSAATAGSQPPVTLKVKTPAAQAAPCTSGAPVERRPKRRPRTTGKVRLFAHPGNPDAIASAARSARARRAVRARRQALPLRAGASSSPAARCSARVRTPPARTTGTCASRSAPAGDSATIDPRPVLRTGRSSDAALHPQGAKGDTTPARRDRQRRVPAVQGRTRSAPCWPTPASRIYACGRARHRRGHDRQARARGARVPLAQRPEADRQRAALRPQPGHRVRLRLRRTTRRRGRHHRDQRHRRSPATRAPARSPT